MKTKRAAVLVLLSTLLLGTTPVIGVEQTGAPAAPPDGGGMGGADTMAYDYSGELTGSLVADNQEITSTSETQRSDESDKNTALVKNGGTLTLEKSTLEKTSTSANDDNSNFYGLNSILLAVNQDSFAYLSNSQLTASDQGSNGLFATDNGTIYANDNTIATEADNSRGMDATYGGTIIANKTTISTKGDHSAALATDRGGGNVSVTDSEFTTQGSGSPLLYSTGDIEVNNVTGTSSGSQIAGMEGLNSIQIYNSELTSELTGTTGSDPIANGVIIYQSTSGDAEAATGETATFEAVNSTLKSATEGTMFYVTNTEANVILQDTKLDFDSDQAALLTIQGNDANNWGTAGSNGGKVTFTGIKQKLAGKINVDSISSLNLVLTEGTTYSGNTEITTNDVNTSATEAPITVTVDKSSKWIVTNDSQVTNLNVEAGGEIVDTDGKSVTILANGETVVEGTGSTTITVTGAYSNQISLDDNSTLSEPSIDRTAFDQYFQLATTFTNKSTATENTETSESVTEVKSSSGNTNQASTSNSRSYISWLALGGVIIVAGALIMNKFRKRTKRRH
ncbi:adhesin [Enterococcus hulanensis]|uniref:adhesin n=1 Tax=Enterococcus hulanensis TaxID=2559929 RepID=UPI00288E895E|nr:adhesin [Enterococcus hulanensis]MDT2659594.1 adhesin [Enterococcus hulanensis]